MNSNDADVLAALREAGSQLERANPFRRPEQYIRSGPPLGLNPPRQGFHPPPPLNRAVRVDVEIQAGTSIK
jgi:hypothetical protein